MKRTFLSIITAACLALTAMAQQQVPTSTSTTTASTTPIGSIPGTSGVSPTGAATYTIPIAVPVGINGMQPQISINYNSQGGYGALGRGWDVAAGSTITRVPRNEFYDGVNDSQINFTNTDALMLDGQRLILLSGTHWEEGAVYGFENENFTRVKIIKDETIKKLYFEVKTKEGLIMTYGKTDNSSITYERGNYGGHEVFIPCRGCPPQIINRPETDYFTMSYRLDKSVDVTGNTMTYTYSNNASYLQSVTYPGGSINLFYKLNSTPPPARYLSGLYDPKAYNITPPTIRFDQLLESIQVKYHSETTQVSDQLLRTYNFNYSGDKLSSIDLTAADGSKMNSTNVNWNPAATLTSVDVCPITDVELNDAISSYASIQYADINGDGFGDRIQLWAGAENNPGYIKVYLYDKSTQTFSSTPISYETGNIYSYTNAMPSIACGDINNDGKQDIALVYYIVEINDKGGQYSGLPCHVGRIRIINLKTENGTSTLEKVAETVIIDGNNNYKFICPSLQALNQKIIITDHNKDGYNDVIYFNDKYIANIFYGGSDYINASITSRRTYSQSDISTLASSSDYKEINILSGDFDGDGKIDISYTLRTNDNHKPCWVIKKNINLDGITPRFIETSDFEGEYDKNAMFTPLFPIDYNSDGKTEYLYHNNPTKVYGHRLSDGKGSRENFDMSFSYTDHQIYPIDIDGDGQTDIVTAEATSEARKEWTCVTPTDQYGTPIGPPKCDSTGVRYPVVEWSFYKNVNGNFEYAGRVKFDDIGLYKMHASIADINNDGVADLVFPKKSHGFHAITMPNAQQQYMVQSITDGMGLTTSFTYKNFTNYEDGQLTGDIRNLKAPLLVVDKVTEQNGSITEYDFQKPKVHIKGKGFLGFTEMTVKNKLANRKTVTTSTFKEDIYYVKYNNSFIPIIYPKYNLYQDKVTQSVFTYNDLLISNSSQTFNSESLRDVKGDVIPLRFFLKPNTLTSTDALTGLSSSTTYSNFDNYGNAKTITSTNGNLTTTVNTTYKSRITDGPEYLPESITTTTVENSISYIRKKTIEYDSNQKGQVVKETTDPGDNNQLETTYSDFDTWGMPQTITVKGKEDGVYVSRVSHKYRTSSGRFLAKEVNAIGQYTLYNWDETTGRLTDKTEYKDKKTSYSYDAWGRLVSTTNTNTGVTVTSTTNNLIGSRELTQGEIDNCTQLGPAQFVYECLFLNAQEKTKQYNQNLIVAKDSNTPYYSVVTTTTDQNSKTVSAPVTVWYDVFGREMKRMTYGLDAGAPIYQFTEYTADGKVYRTSAPTLNTTAQSWDKTYKYDEYGRVLTITTPAGKESYSYNQKSSSVKSIDGMTTLTTINDAGQTISVERFYAAAFTPHKKVTYTYYPSGLVHTTTPDGGATVTMEYDLQGRRTKLTDPDAGETTTEYSAFGDIIKESRKKGSKYNVTDYTYSADGLLIQKVINNSLLQNYKYYYDDNIKGRLKIKAKCAQHNVHYYYDDNNKNYDRVLKIDETVGVKTYTTSYTYDQYGRKLTETFPTGYTTTNHYDGYGNMTQITDGKKRTVWEAITENERGQLTEVNKNGITQRFAYDNAGRTTGIKAYKAIPNPGSMPSIDWLVQMEYGYTTEGNLDYRKEFRDGNSQEYQRENFAYDDFNRLTSWAITKANASTPALTHSITYDPTTGNITNKSDVGSINLQYTNATKPHQLTGIDGVPAGVPTNDLVITYTDFDKVTKIQQNPKGASDTYKTYDITYGVDDQRITSSYSINFASQVKTTYLGNFEEEYDAVNKTYKKTHYLHGAILIQNYAADGTTLTSEQYYSTVSDFQGSLIALVDEQGAVAERYAFDPWGARRNPDDWTQTDSRTSWITHRGYTGHEHIDVFGVINMNGRVYDPMTAIFFSPDPFVQSAGDWMNYNRYTYCLNNPLKYTDPSGELIWLIPAAILLFTDVGYDIQKAFSPVAVHIDLSFGSHSNGIGLDVSVGIPQLAPISYRYDVGATYYFNRPGGYGSGWQVRNGAEWGLGFGFFQYGGMRYRDWNSDGLQADQVVHTAQIGTPLINASYSNDTEDSFPWAKYVPLIPKLKDGQIPRLDSDRYRTASGRLRVGLFELGFFLHTGEGTRISVTDGTRHFAGGNIDDPDRSNGIIYFGFGPFKMGWDSEKNRNALQNRLAHDGLSGQPQYGWRYPWVLMLDRSSRFVFQFGNF